MKFILFCATLDLLDNPTEMRIVKNSVIVVTIQRILTHHLFK